jgi:DMSO/TMAO reductase YedYZ molybdopterin-dependent catalytic subunit
MSERRTLDELPEHPAPAIEPEGQIRLAGVVDSPRTLTLANLALMPQTTLTEDFDCEEGWTVTGQTWTGVLVGDIFGDVIANDEGLWVEFASGEFSFSAPMPVARGALVAVQLNGEPLSPMHGGPCRLYLPGEACYTSIKWLDRIEARRDPGPNNAAEIAKRRLRGPASP